MSYFFDIKFKVRMSDTTVDCFNCWYSIFDAFYKMLFFTLDHCVNLCETVCRNIPTAVDYIAEAVEVGCNRFCILVGKFCD